MIITSIVHWCPACHSTNIVKNGHTQYGAQRCKCRDCGKTRVLIPKPESPIRDFVESALRERLTLRGIARIFGGSVQPVLLLLKGLTQALPALKASLMPWQPGDVLELDETVEFRRLQSEQALVVGGAVSQNTAGRGLCHRRSQ